MNNKKVIIGIILAIIVIVAIGFGIFKATHNEDYLYKNFDGEDNKGGCLFVDSRNQSIDDDNIIIHGHNMKDKSMFGTLSNLLKSDYFNENKKIYIFLEGKKLEYEIFSVYVNELDFNPYVPNFTTDEEFNEYINTSRRKSFHDLEYIAEGENKILTLSTCTNATGIERTIVHAKLISTSDI